MQLLRLILIEVSRRRGGIIGWGLGLGAYCAMILSLAPQLAEQFADLDLSNIAVYQAFGVTGALDSTPRLLAVYIPFIGLLLAVYASLAGTQTLAGEEDGGTLEMILALPLPRWLIVTGKALALAVVLALIVLIVFVLFALTFVLMGDSLAPLTLQQLWNVSWEMWPLAFMFAMLGMFCGAYLPRRSYALAVTLGILIGSYLFNNFGVNVDALENLLVLQPFYYYRGGDVLLVGVDWRRSVTLIILGVLLLLLAQYSFARRDVTVGQWPWQRDRLPQT